MVERDAAFGARTLELLAARLGGEVERLDHLQPALAREVLGAGAGQQHVGAVLHHRARGAHRAADAADAGDGAGAQLGAVHHGGVELVRLGAGEDGAVAGVEQRAVFQHLDRQADRVERAAAAQQQRLAGEHDAAQCVVVGLGGASRPAWPR